MDRDKFALVAKSFHDKMLVTLMTKNQMICYDGRIAGVECVVVGYARDAKDPTKSVVPLAVVITPEIYAVLDVDATRAFG